MYEHCRLGGLEGCGHVDGMVTVAVGSYDGRIVEGFCLIERVHPRRNPCVTRFHHRQLPGIVAALVHFRSQCEIDEIGTAQNAKHEDKAHEDAQAAEGDARFLHVVTY